MKKTLVFPLVALLAACGSTTPNYDARFGDAVREARTRMTLNPQPSNADDTMAGMDGRAAKEAITRYEGTFKAPPPVTNVINIGGTVAGGR